MQDIILTRLFEQERWSEAIHHGIEKKMNRHNLSTFCLSDSLAALYAAIRDGKKRIFPPHTLEIPKKNSSEMRIVMANEDEDRVLLTNINNLLFELCPDMIHPQCVSYQRGISCDGIVRKASEYIKNAKGRTIGWKSDLSKYFDSVPIRYIDKCFDDIESRVGHSAVIDLLRDYYHSDTYFDGDNNLCEQYKSLKQGCAVAAFLADAVLYHIDEKLSQLDGYYVRYSDDAIFIGKDYEKAMEIMKSELEKMEMKLNPKKIEWIDSRFWFRFIGFSLRGGEISLSDDTIANLQKDIDKVTILDRNATYKSALRAVNRIIYIGDGKHSWYARALFTCNVPEDINTINDFVIDRLRAVALGNKRTKLGGIGFSYCQKRGCINRGKGQNVTANRKKMPLLDGYRTIKCMMNARRSSRAVYDVLVAQM